MEVGGQLFLFMNLIRDPQSRACRLIRIGDSYGNDAPPDVGENPT